MKIVERNTKEGRNRLADRQTYRPLSDRKTDPVCPGQADRRTDRQGRNADAKVTSQEKILTSSFFMDGEIVGKRGRIKF